ncbi:hypothetical protein D3C78_1560790 [compost metagenome]
MVFRKTTADFVPEALVAPVLRPVIQRTLDVIAAARVRPHGTESKTTRVVGIDELMVDGRHVSQNAEPAERIDLLEFLDRALRHRFAADPVEAVAAGDEIAIDTVGYAVFLIGDIGAGAIEIMRLDIRCIVNRD